MQKGDNHEQIVALELEHSKVAFNMRVIALLYKLEPLNGPYYITNPFSAHITIWPRSLLAFGIQPIF